MASRGRKSNKEDALRQYLWRKANPGKNKIITDRADLKRKYGLTETQFAYLLGSQQGLCAVCKQEEKILSNQGKPRNLSVDHCHATGKIRGLLCYRCNHALGLCEDKPNLLRELATYLEQADTGFII